jgi:hypothetical protein
LSFIITCPSTYEDLEDQSKQQTLLGRQIRRKTERRRDTNNRRKITTKAKMAFAYVLPLRIIQAVFAVIVLGLMAYG